MTYLATGIYQQYYFQYRATLAGYGMFVFFCLQAGAMSRHKGAEGQQVVYAQGGY